MTSRPGESKGRKDVFSGTDGRPFPGRIFDVKWIRHHEVFFRDCEHITNNLNEQKPVKIGRDGQELAGDAGRNLCELIDKLYYNSRLRQNLPIDEEYVAADGESPSASQSSSFGAPMQSLSTVAEDASRKRAPDIGMGLSATTQVEGTTWCPKKIKVEGTGDSQSAGGEISPADAAASRLAGLSSSGWAKLATLAAALKTSAPGSAVTSVGNALAEGEMAPANSVASGVIKAEFTECPVNVKAWMEDAERNPALLVFPLDLTNMTYDEYSEAHQSAQSAADVLPKFPVDDWLNRQAKHFGVEHAAMARGEAGQCMFDVGALERWIVANFGEFNQ